MLGFFRKYQKIFFIFVTTVVVISFSFFGVINSVSGPQAADPVVYTAIDGTGISKSELEQMSYFLMTDAQDKLFFGGRQGPNFLNDGVLEKDFLQTGLAVVLARRYKDFLREDFEPRARKEKNFKLYRHPQAEFISVENAWNFIAPEMKRHFNELQAGSDPLSEGELDARIQLYLGQRKLPPHTLRQVLAYQNKQYSWVPRDPNLQHADLSVFGYKTFDDWFGPRFVRLAAAVILDVAKMAKEQGIAVSDDEALASLIRQTHISYEENKKSPYFNSVNVDDYLKGQLRMMHMDMKQAARIWKQVLLFRRYFDSIGNSIFVDPLPYQNFYEYASMYVSGNLYQLPEDMRLKNFQDFQRFEIYLEAVAKKDASSHEALLDLPREFYSPEEVVISDPEFVQKRYRLSVASVDADKIKEEIGTRQLWDWQMQDENWSLVRKSFPDLGIEEGETREERFAALDSLSQSAREKVDRFSREKILGENPEWIDSALASARPETGVYGIRRGGGQTPFEGIKDSSKLSRLLDNRDPELAKYSEDGRFTYRVEVLEEAAEMDVMTFAELSRDGTLDEKLTAAMESHYVNIREQNGEKFKAPDGGWKPLSDVRDLVAKDYFSDVLLAVNGKVSSSDPLTVDDAARFRFTVMMENLKKQVEKDPEGSGWVRGGTEEQTGTGLSPNPPLVHQWKLIKSPYKLSRSGGNDEKIDREKALALEEGDWSEIFAPPEGDVTFFHLKSKGFDKDRKAMNEAMMEGQDLLSAGAKKLLMEKTLAHIEEISPIQLDYMNSKEKHAKLD